MTDKNFLKLSASAGLALLGYRLDYSGSPCRGRHGSGDVDAIILDKLARIEAQAMKLFSRRESAATVSGSLKIPLREAFRLQAMHREQQKEAA